MTRRRSLDLLQVIYMGFPVEALAAAVAAAWPWFGWESPWFRYPLAGFYAFFAGAAAALLWFKVPLPNPPAPPQNGVHR